MEKLEPIYVRGVEFRKEKPRRFTVCGIVDDNGFLNIGVAICSDTDQFVKRIGRELSLKKAKDGNILFSLKTDRIKKIIKFLNYFSIFVSLNIDGYNQFFSKNNIDIDTDNLPF